MSCKSGIYTINSIDEQDIAVGGIYAPTTIVRRYGPSCQLVGNGISIQGAGYYDVEVVAVVTATAIGTVTASLYKDGVEVPGATATVTASAIGDVVALPITALVRQNNDFNESILTIVISDQNVTTNNLAFNVEKR